eukprot:3390650-Amphidinium_carterae.1
MQLASNFGQRYVFDSLTQCIAHQVSHHHYALSASTLKEDSIVLQVLIKSDWLETTGRAAVNGYCYSVMLDSMPFESFKITGC